MGYRSRAFRILSGSWVEARRTHIVILLNIPCDHIIIIIIKIKNRSGTNHRVGSDTRDSLIIIKTRLIRFGNL